MHESEIVAALGPLTDAFDTLGVRYYLVGSVASSAYGPPRTTLDVDMVAEILPTHVQPLVDRLEKLYYIDGAAILDAIAHRSTFNVIHLATMIKVDVFVAGVGPYQEQVFERARRNAVGNATNAGSYTVASVEDVVIGKLTWYEQGGRVSALQWKDVVGVIKVQKESIDMAYLSKWCEKLGLLELLDRAVREAE